MITQIQYRQLKGLVVKVPCRVASNTNIVLSAATNTIDGISLSLKDRILLFNQNLPEYNGIYFVRTLGTGSDGLWERSIDMNQDFDVFNGVEVYISTGSTYTDSTFILENQNLITLNVTPLNFVIKTSGAGTNGTSGSSGINGTSGSSGINGTSGSSGSSGTNGTSGSSGINGTSGSSGINGTSGSSGSSGTNGTSGSSGTNGTSGSSGTNGTSGSSGTNGTSGSSGTNGTSGSSGTNGSSGINGTSGSSGSSGTNGTSGSSGSSGTNGTSGSSGTNGTSGSSGTNGTSGSSGINGTSGSSGSSGTNGTSGSSGTNGTSGTNGSNGTSGSSGINGTSGSSGSSGTNGTSGSSGTNGTSGSSGTNGTSGSSGTSASAQGIQLDPITATFSGMFAPFTAGESVVKGNLCYFKNDGKMWKTDANSLATSLGIAIATDTITGDTSGIFLLIGFIGGYSILTVGGAVYASTSAGALQQTVPSGTDDVGFIAGIAISSTMIYFNPSLTTIERV